MITLYLKTYKRMRRGTYLYGYTDEQIDSMHNNKQLYLMLNTKVSVEQLTPITMPDNIFDYYGWTVDYNTQEAIRWKGTDREMVFRLQRISADSDLLKPSDWLNDNGNVIKFSYYDSKAPRFNQETDKEVLFSTQNPSGNVDNVWLISYQRSDGTEVYLYELWYDERDNIILRQSIAPRRNTNLAPGPDNVLSVVDLDLPQQTEENTPPDNSSQTDPNQYQDPEDNNNNDDGVDDDNNNDDTDDNEEGD